MKSRHFLSNLSSFMIFFLFIFCMAGQILVPDAVSASQCAGAETTLIQCDSTDEAGQPVAGGLWEIILTGIRILVAGIGIVAVGGILYGAFIYTSSGDNSAKLQQAKSTIRNVVVGLVLFVGMYSTMEFIIPGGVFNRTYDFGIIASEPPTDSNTNNGGGGISKDEKTTIRIGAYNTASVTTSDDLEVSKLERGMKQMQSQDAEIVALQEFSVRQTTALRDSSVWGIYRSDMDGDRGLGVAYKKNIFKRISESSVTIPHPRSDQKEPILTLERNRDKARVTVISVHLKAIDGDLRSYNEYQLKQQKVVRDKALQLASDGHTVIAAGDYNWFFDDKDGWMSPMISRGDRVMRIFGTSDQRFSDFKQYKDTAITDHALISVNVTTGWYRE